MPDATTPDEEEEARKDDDFLGRLSFSIEDIMEDKTFQKPEWHPLWRTSLETGKVYKQKRAGKKGKLEDCNGPAILCLPAIGQAARQPASLFPSQG